MARILKANAGAKLKMPIASYAVAAAFMARFRDGRTDSAKLAHNTVVVAREGNVRGEDAYAIRLYNTDIVTFYRDGTIKLDNGGHQTVTTKARMNEILRPLGLTIDQKDYEWYVREPASSVKPIPYFNGMVLRIEGRTDGVATVRGNPSKIEELASIYAERDNRTPPSKSVVCQSCGGSVRVPRVPVRNTGLLRCECGALVPYTAKGRKAVKGNPRPGKFEGSGKLGEALHEMVSDSSFLDDELGDVNDFGWYGLVIDAKVPGHRGMIHAIVNEDSLGFFDVTVYPSKAKAHTAWDRLKDEYDVFCDERGDDGEGY